MATDYQPKLCLFKRYRETTQSTYMTRMEPLRNPKVNPIPKREYHHIQYERWSTCQSFEERVRQIKRFGLGLSGLEVQGSSIVFQRIPMGKISGFKNEKLPVAIFNDIASN